MCTGLGGYHLDDRLVAFRVRRLLRHGDRMAVAMQELSDLELCAVLSRCRALLGTRMHSTILSMQVGTPAVVLPYEHKSIGLFRRWGLPIGRSTCGGSSRGR